ncbi:MAG TPA: N-6 DNA methylase, partial [Ktedonobacteraceae bacterium]|nr:N-6 DNA methylase [Ktedonobacteraceae bacterium]
MAVSNLFNWYETSLPPDERKRRGHFSTPPQLIEGVLDACGYTAEQDLSHLRVLDPACGSGNFLISATRRLMAFGRRVGLDDDALAALVQRNIWGFDPDPVACFLAEMQLQTTFAQEAAIHSSVRASRESAPDEEQIASHKPICPQSKILHYPHIHQADGLALPWEQCENVDLFLANPPYLASKNTDLSGYTPARQRGQADSYLLFLRLAVQVVRPKGWIGLVLPDPLLARASASIERQLLLAETTVHHLWHLSDVFAASVGAVVIIAQKYPSSSSHYICWKRGPWRLSETQEREKKTTLAMGKEEPFSGLMSHDGKQTVSQVLLRSQPGAELRYLLSEVEGTLVARLHTYCHQVWQVTTEGAMNWGTAGAINRAPTTRAINCQKSVIHRVDQEPEQVLRQSHQSSPLTSLDAFVLIRRGEEISKDSPLLSKINPAECLEHPGDGPWYPVLRGGVDVRPYSIPVAQCQIPYQAIKKPLERYLA